MNRILTIGIVLSSLIIYACSPSSPAGIDELDDSLNYLTQGQEITTQSFAALSKQLQWAMKTGGIEEAVPFCNNKAMELTDSLSEAYSCTIKRTSSKYRNPTNAPDSVENIYLEKFEKQLRSGQALGPFTEKRESVHHYYQPILVGKLCLKCHGTIGKDISSTDYQIIDSLYPRDLAINFEEGQLRGMWSIEFKDQALQELKK